MPTTSTDPRAAAAALLVPGTTCHGFAVERRETVPELDSDAYVLRHTASGARLLYLACDDENKAFAIGFKTPPADSTGVFHILEHSVLCGSAKFPVKEPFVDLIKSSMQTFLNAMTYPDKTIYPVATTNEQDLYNLMDVYLDAVFNPAIYTKPTIFEQEGWHYELDLPEDEGDGNPAGLREGTLRYNGVVFNEMKGALSDPMSVLDDAVNAALYPDTAYAHESGGDPRAIPTLTYEHFLDTRDTTILPTLTSRSTATWTWTARWPFWTSAICRSRAPRAAAWTPPLPPARTRPRWRPIRWTCRRP